MTDTEFLDVWKTSAAHWPTVVLAMDAFREYLAARIPDFASQPQSGQPQFRWAELYIACGCSLGHTAAMQAFEKAYFSEIDKVCKRRRDGPAADELRQLLRVRLFTATHGSPKIGEYSGRGDLRAWLRIVATGTALNVETRQAREVLLEPPDLSALLGGGNDPELTFARAHYAQAVRVALNVATAALESRERTLLRYALIDRLTVAEVGVLYGVHRATAARWIVKAHEHLVTELKAALAAELGTSKEELASVFALVRSQLDLSLERVLS